MAWRYLIKLLLFPPGGPLLLLAVALVAWQHRPRLARSAAAIAFLSLWLLSTPRMVQWLAAPLKTYPPINLSALNSAHHDAIVVLGGGREPYADEWGSHEVSVQAMQRVRYAATLAQHTGLPVLASGGLHHGKIAPSEAALMAEVLSQDYRLPAILLEEQSRTTWENAIYSAAMLKPLGKQRILLGTHAWHMQRSVWSYEQQGFTVTAAPVAPHNSEQNALFFGLAPDARALWKNVQLLNEWAGLLLYPLNYSQ